jgi:hypothetical protein
MSWHTISLRVSMLMGGWSHEHLILSSSMLILLCYTTTGVLFSKTQPLFCGANWTKLKVERYLCQLTWKTLRRAKPSLNARHYLLKVRINIWFGITVCLECTINSVPSFGEILFQSLLVKFAVHVMEMEVAPVLSFHCLSRLSTCCVCLHGSVSHSCILNECC